MNCTVANGACIQARVGFLDKEDRRMKDEGLLELVELAVHADLTKYKYPGDIQPVSGSALLALEALAKIVKSRATFPSCCMAAVDRC